ncbi:4-phosphoerythronate dehydrogenase [Acinetobacter sp. c2-A9]|uniref:4-phosphoerythronate dehydrogenase n=1 Tax=Acinetobacter sp. c2-A9 TaxID=3342802 RepID=UPI0035B7BEEF
MKILVDENLAESEYFFSDFGEIISKAGRKITADDVQDIDALLVRSVTQVDEKLLKNSPVKFVGSATIGTDHLDINYLQNQNITWANAAGCNVQAVAEYVITALYHVKPECLEKDFSLGIVGLGNVGKRLVRLAQQLGWQVKGYDPFVQCADVQQVDFADVLQCDAVSIHTPLTTVGDYPTYHMFDAKAFAQMPKDTILINSARGAVVSEQALLADIARTGRTVVLDVFEHEPQISQAVLDAVKIVTPHIAGYSLEGKLRGAAMIYQAFCEHFGFEVTKDINSLMPKCDVLFDAKQDIKAQLKQHLKAIYPIGRDDAELRACLKNGVIVGDDFDRLRKNYPLRREWDAYGFYE